MTVRIYRPMKSATQSGTARTKYWLLEYDAQKRQLNRARHCNQQETLGE